MVVKSQPQPEAPKSPRKALQFDGCQISYTSGIRVDNKGREGMENVSKKNDKL